MPRKAKDTKNERVDGSFAARLKARMAELKVSQSALAKQVGIDRSELNRMVNGLRRPNTDQVTWLATALDTTATDLLGEELPPDLEKNREELQKLARRILEVEADAERATREVARVEATLAAERQGFERERAELAAQLEVQMKARLAAEQEVAEGRAQLTRERSSHASAITVHGVRLAKANERIQELENRDTVLRQAIAKEQSEKVGVGALLGLGALFLGAALNDRPKRRR